MKKIKKSNPKNFYEKIRANQLEREGRMEVSHCNSLRDHRIYFETFSFYSMSVVSEIMSKKPVVTVDVKDNNLSALHIAKLMAIHRIGSVVLVEGNDKSKPVGIITERDIIKKVSAKNKSADQVSIGSIMSSPLIVIRSIDSIDTAAETMSKNKIKRLVVLEQDGSMIGVLSVSDIANKLAKIVTEDYERYRSLRGILDTD